MLPASHDPIKQINVIVTATGSVVGEGIIKCLKLANSKSAEEERKFTYNIISVDMSPLAPGLYRGRNAILVPSPDSSSYIDKLIGICNKYDVKAIFVGSDEELLALSDRTIQIENQSGARVIGNSPRVLEIAKDKWNTFEFLKREGIPCPETALPEEADEFSKRTGFPLVVKPREGHGSIHFYIVTDKEELQFAISQIRKSNLEPLLQEYLKGLDCEFTTGVTLEGGKRENVQSSIAMRRILKHGQTYKAFIDDFPKVKEPAEKAALRLRAEGPINVQSKLSSDVSKIFEINPRFSASCPIRAMAGVNEPDLVFRNQILGEKVTISKIEHLVALRYWNEVYVPYESYNKLSDVGFSEDPHSFIANYF